MERCQPLSVFFEAIGRDARICITHIGIYAALVQYWQASGFQNPLRAYAHELMPLAKISASTTYHRCIRDLHDFGYILYEPSYKRNVRSAIYLKTGMSEDGQNRDHMPPE
ncbi:hypothetical protein BDD43_2232 [Mucilaginibacter gracilis]|uniref:Uncharacterized protein n=1 Tax=Mucilaginibacter gracilis TaxID=423350 RepID=A0A495IZC5_9SPHI|nr:hypothetical protein [Mucilaginibacter gracilis]RKR82065.1 hypothetical protein BDD43_2232 [Mucilaginibacter gracilis]